MTFHPNVTPLFPDPHNKAMKKTCATWKFCLFASLSVYILFTGLQVIASTLHHQLWPFPINTLIMALLMGLDLTL
jgi:antibiotic biosynthesis monooxygenase (ABM) superfamily enzyme